MPATASRVATGFASRLTTVLLATSTKVPNESRSYGGDFETLNRYEDVARAFSCQLPHTVDDEPLEVLGRGMEIERRAIAIDLPQCKNLGLRCASGDVEGDDAGLRARGIAQLSEDGFGFVAVFWSEGETDGLNQHAAHRCRPLGKPLPAVNQPPVFLRPNWGTILQRSPCSAPRARPGGGYASEDLR